MTGEKMVRVSRLNPCPVCGKSDWCLVAADAGAAICARVQEGSVKRSGEAGWLHILRRDGAARKRRSTGRHVPSVKPAARDFAALAEECRAKLTGSLLKELARTLAVSAESLRRLEVGWNGGGYTFPMRDETGRVVGLRIRYPSGSKAAEKGSSNGLFIPTDMPADGLLLVCEGESDTAAALDLGFAAVGRPSCNTGRIMLSRFARGRDAVIVADNDPPGRQGAKALASGLVPYCSSVRVVYPADGIKDLRQWKVAGITAAELSDVIKATPKCRLSIRSGCAGGPRRRARHGCRQRS